MAQQWFSRMLGLFLFYWYAVFSFTLYLGLSIRSGEFFRKTTEKDKLQYQIARDQFWNLSKFPLPGFQHHFHTLRDGARLHYIANKSDGPQKGALVIFLHGFPDSSVMWRHVLQEPAIPTEATLICVDLPGYGGSDSFEKYDTRVLEALTEFIVAMREQHLADDTAKTFVVGHDWGCVLAFRLAADASLLADRFIVTNGPHVELALANRDRILHSASKIFRQFKASPIRNFKCLGKSFGALRPLIYQVLLFGYIFAFHLPASLVKYLGTGGNNSFLRGTHKYSHGKSVAAYKPQESLAATMGPGVNECRPTEANGCNGATKLGYGESVLRRAQSPKEAFWHMTGYYRDGVAFQPWTKSLEAIMDLSAIDNEASNSSSPMRRRSSSSNSSAMNGMYSGVLHAPATIIWGGKDLALSKTICLDGIGDYLAKDSEVVLLPKSGHWTTVEPESRAALASVIGMYASNGAEKEVLSVTKHVNDVYEGATMVARK